MMGFRTGEARPGLRLAVTAGAIVLVACVVVSMWTRAIVSQKLVDEVQQRLLTVARSLAATAGEAILKGDAVAVGKAIQQAHAAEPQVAYLIVAGSGGRALGHSLRGELPRGLAEMVASTPLGLREPYVTELRARRQTLYDVAVPVVAGADARVHVGVSRAALMAPLGEIDLVLGSMALFVTAVAASLGWRFGMRLGRPTELLIAAAHRIGSGDHDAQVPTRTGDPHMDRLAEAFAQMQRDIAEHRAAEERAVLRAANAEKLAALGTLVAGIAHQVNNPLGGIQSCLEMAASTSDPKERHEYLSLADEGVGKLSDVMGRLVAYVRGGGGGSAPVQVNDVVKNAVAFCVTWDRASDPAPVLELSEGLPLVRGEADALSDVVVNLYSNARIAAPGKAIHLATRACDGGVQVAVTDEGPGVPVELRQRIFDPFFTTRPQGQGTGLGLALSESIVRRHGGGIEVTDAPGGGARFVVWLRTAAATEERA